MTDRGVVYALRDSEGGDIRYVGSTGKTAQERLQMHRYNCHNKEMGEWIRSVGSDLRIEILAREKNRKKRTAKEIKWISRLYGKGHSLFNKIGIKMQLSRAAAEAIEIRAFHIRKTMNSICERAGIERLVWNVGKTTGRISFDAFAKIEKALGEMEAEKRA